MKAITKVIIFIIFLTVVTCIVGTGIYISKHGVSHMEQLTTKSPQHISSSQANDTSPQAVFSEPSLQPDQNFESKRTKRAIIFRPLFVYRQQQIKKERLKATREQTVTQKPKYASGYPYYSSRNNMG